MATASLLPNGEQMFIDGNGVPYAGGKVYFYIPNTLTPKNTWQDSSQNVLNVNPVELDAAGRAVIYGSGQYRQILKDADGNTIWDKLTQDVYGLVMSSDNVFTGNNTFEGSVFFANGVIPLVAAGGTVNAITATYTPFPSTLQDKTLVAYISTGRNTSTTPTFSPNSFPVHTITARGGSPLVQGDSGASGYVGILEYNLSSTRWELLNPAGAGSFLTGFTSGAGAITAADTVISAIQKLDGNGSSVVRVQNFLASGTYTPNATMKYCLIYAWGAGGGGGGAAATASNGAAGGGGGAGGYSIHRATAAEIGVSKTVTIGAAGTGGSAGANNGSAGGNTSVGSLCVANGGQGGLGGAAGTIPGNGGAGGSVGTGNVLSVPGTYGDYGISVGNTSIGALGGAGGNSSLGGGAGNIYTTTAATGRTAEAFGAGGAGGCSFNGSAAQAGGNGAAGYVYIIEFCST